MEIIRFHRSFDFVLVFAKGEIGFGLYNTCVRCLISNDFDNNEKEKQQYQRTIKCEQTSIRMIRIKYLYSKWPRNSREQK